LKRWPSVNRARLACHSFGVRRLALKAFDCVCRPAMAQVWVPIDALTQGKLPPVCLLTGTENAALRDRPVSWVGHPTERGSALTTPGSVALAATVGYQVAILAAGFKQPPVVQGRVPLSDSAVRRMALTRPLVFLVVLASMVLAVVAGGVTNSAFVFLGALLLGFVGSVAFGVVYGRWAGLALVRREGNQVLLDLPNDRAAAAIAQALPKSVDGRAHSVG
jgi:hypothetical protein